MLQTSPCQPKRKSCLPQKFEEKNPGIIRTCYRYAEKTIGNQASFKMLATIMVSKAKSLPGIGHVKFTAYNVRVWFKKQGGKDRSAKEKPFLTADQKQQQK